MLTAMSMRYNRKMWQGIKNIYHLFIALLANLWFGFPSLRLTVIGVTGTDGKTTTVHLIYHILKSAKKQVSMISSVAALIGNEQLATGFHVTTPFSWQIQSFLKKAVEAGSTHMVLEVTSHALDQYRVWGVDFTIGVLTNVTHEHLDYHKTYENYVKTKVKLLKMAKVVVVNRDDESYNLMNSKFNPPNRRTKIQVKSQKFLAYGMGLNADINPTGFPFKTKLIGEFNQYNCLAAIAACRELGVSDEIILKAIASFELPIGRMEIVYEDEFTVMIDFAHTPNALEQILKTVRPNVKGRLIHVFGSAGERDYEKRPEMGEISGKYVDIIILSAEDPRSESVEKITREIESGIMNYESRIQDSTLLKIPDRQEAITTAIQMARKGDLILLTGKGHERSMTYGKKDIHWSEHEAVLKALQ